MTSCGHGCGTISNCAGHCTASYCSNSGCVITCEYYCLHSKCSFSCGGDSTIENTLNCVGLCTSSSCSATGRNIFLN